MIACFALNESVTMAHSKRFLSEEESDKEGNMVWGLPSIFKKFPRFRVLSTFTLVGNHNLVAL